ncbi:MAG: hypothetical protein R3B48_30090 [Kofleriaceae bacterium]
MAPVRRTRRAQPAAETPPRKPVAFARRVSLFERTVSVRLAPAALDLLLDAAKVLSEGELVEAGFAGSTMVSVDLASTASLVSDPVDPSTAQLLAELCRADPQVRARGRALALAHAERVAGAELGPAQVDLESTAHGAQLRLSFNVEATRRTA